MRAPSLILSGKRDIAARDLHQRQLYMLLRRCSTPASPAWLQGLQACWEPLCSSSLAKQTSSPGFCTSTSSTCFLGTAAGGCGGTAVAAVIAAARGGRAWPLWPMGRPAFTSKVLREQLRHRKSVTEQRHPHKYVESCSWRHAARQGIALFAVAMGGLHLHATLA